jgi:hypothetical protein
MNIFFNTLNEIFYLNKIQFNKFYKTIILIVN